MGSKIPPVSSSVPVEIRRPLEAMRNELNNADTEGELKKLGLLTTKGELPVTPPVTYPTPLPVTGLRATGAFATIIIEWDDPSAQAGYGYTNVYRAQVDDVGQAVLIGATSASLFGDTPPNSATSVTYYYWVRGVNKNGVEGPFNKTPGTPASTASDPSYMMDIITSKDWVAATQNDVFNYAVPSVPNGFKYKCTVGGLTGGVEPTWPVIDGNTVVDNQVTWEAVNENKTIPFAIDPITGNVYIDIAFIRDATITSAKIKDLSADKISAGTIVAAVELIAATITGGSIAIGSKFSVDTAGNMMATNATLSGDITATSGTVSGLLTIGGTGAVRSGQTAYNTGQPGFWIGSSGGKVSIGDPAGDNFRWDGSSLTINGDLLRSVGVGTKYFASTLIYQAPKVTSTWDKYSQITLHTVTGTVKATCMLLSWYNISWQIRVDGVVKGSGTNNGVYVYTAFSVDVNVVSGSRVELWCRHSIGYPYWDVGPLSIACDKSIYNEIENYGPA